ncbi:hypothetical protein [Virgibacillus litoralis]|uniref:Uncharacterized protein n=1 Tax=Virgibacillus litoralis TaxID=578221 RepID=A0ABS4HIZ7_9BACI|nr:hypothetical protein [Virgibacillus litoralis]MBP1950881.1 hypothetical protein [Virgibacillus litoralis]
MNEEKKKKYLYLLMGYLGFLLMGFGIARYISVVQDTIGLALTMFGYIFLVTFFGFVENKIGVTKKETIIFRIGLIVPFVLLLFIY